MHYVQQAGVSVCTMPWCPCGSAPKGVPAPEPHLKDETRPPRLSSPRLWSACLRVRGPALSSPNPIGLGLGFY